MAQNKDTEREDKGDMSTSEAGRKGGQRTSDLISEGKEMEGEAHEDTRSADEHAM